MPTCRICGVRLSGHEAKCPSCGESVSGSANDSTQDLRQQITALLQQNRKIEAVKIYRQQMGVSLMEAKEAVETIGEGGFPPAPAGPDSDLEREILELVRQGQKLQAVKLYKERNGSDLLSSKRAVEALAARHGYGSSSSSIGNTVLPWWSVVLFALVAIGVIGAAILAIFLI